MADPENKGEAQAEPKPAEASDKKRLRLRFHGRIVDHLAAQTYQSPISAIAEMVANGWDADAGSVAVTVPANLDDGSALNVADDGIGMTFEEVQDRYLAVGLNRREDDPAAKTAQGRPLMGRKGIGKFAGFGIADRMTIETVSSETGEMTRFTLDFDRIRGESDAYVDESPTDVPFEWFAKGEHDGEPGTCIEQQPLGASGEVLDEPVAARLVDLLALLGRVPSG